MLAGVVTFDDRRCTIAWRNKATEQEVEAAKSRPLWPCQGRGGQNGLLTSLQMHTDEQSRTFTDGAIDTTATH